MNGSLRSSSGYLPDELLSAIFVSCLEPDDIGCTVPSKHSAPLVLSWVCRHWRRICLATPRLWSGISLFDQPPPPPRGIARVMTTTPALARSSTRRYITKRANLLHLLDLWIARSNWIPISIKFSYTDLWEAERGRPMLFLPGADECSEYVRDMEVLNDKLLTCRHRWRALDVSVLDLSVTERLLQAISALPASPQLEHLSIATQYLGIFGEVRSHNLALSPNLRTVKILSPLIVPDAGGASFQHLSELELKFCSSMSGCLQWIDTAPNLETLKVRFFTAEAQTLEGETRLRHLPRLKVLDVTAFSNDSDPGPLLSLLRAPALTELKVDTSDLIEAREWTCVSDLLRHSGCPLEFLTLHGTPMTTEEIIECLKLVPDVTHLDLGSITDDQLRALTFYPLLQDASPEVTSVLGDGTPLCPNLKALVISDIEECTVDALVKMITSRHKRTIPAPDNENASGETSEGADAIPSPEVGTEVHGHEPVPNRDGDGEERFRTLEALVIGYDPEYAVLSHPDIIECMEAGLFVEAALPEGFEILNEGNSLIEIEEPLSGAITGF